MLVTFVKQLRHFGFIVPAKDTGCLSGLGARLPWQACRTGGAGPREHTLILYSRAGSGGIGDVASIDLKKRACVHQKRLRRNVGGRYLMSYKSEWKECAETPLSCCLLLYFRRF